MIFVKQDGAQAGRFCRRARSNSSRCCRAQAVAVQLPIGSESSFEAWVDLVAQKAYRFSEDGRDVTVSDVCRQAAAATEARDKLIEEVAGSDDDLMAAYADHGAHRQKNFQLGLQRAVAAGRTVSGVHSGSAAQNRGVQPLLDTMMLAWFPQLRWDGRGSKNGSEVRRSPKNNNRCLSFRSSRQGSRQDGARLRISGKVRRTLLIWNASPTKGGKRVGPALCSRPASGPAFRKPTPATLLVRPS